MTKPIAPSLVFFCLAVAAGGPAASSGCATPPPVTAPGLPLKKVVVYRNGVGYFERGGRVQSDRVQFRVRRDEVGDFLASLAVLERGGSSVRSAAFPLEVEKPHDASPPEPPSEPVRPFPAPAPNESKVAGGDPHKLQTVVMSLDGREHDLQVGYIAATPVWRPSYRLVIGKDGGASLQAWGIVQNLSGEDWNNVSLSLIAEAPLAFDASLAVPVIPVRPTVTDGGDVIAVVPRSETSLAGAPPPPPAAAPAPEAAMAAPAEIEMSDAMEQAEEKATSVPRSKQSSRAAGGASNLRTKSEAYGKGGMGLSGVGQLAAPAQPYSRETRNLSALAAIALQAGATRYELPTPVSIPNKSATMVMLLDRRIPGEAISLFAPDAGVPDSAAHPFRVARFTNATGGLLERGPLAIFSEGAFLGQGMTDPLPDGATATVPFALERTLAIDVTRESHEEGVRLQRIEGGTLTVVRDAVWLTKYRVKNGADRPAKLLVKHPRMLGARLNKPPIGTEDNVGSGSALVPTVAGPRGNADVTLDERQSSERPLDWLSPLADEAVSAYIGDQRADPVIVSQLKAAWEVRKLLVKATEQQQKLSAEDQERRRSTEETRANLKALEKNGAAADLRAKLTSRLAAESARLDVVGKQLVEVRLKLNESQIRFNEAVRAIKLLNPLPAA